MKKITILDVIIISIVLIAVCFVIGGWRYSVWHHNQMKLHGEKMERRNGMLIKLAERIRQEKIATLNPCSGYTITVIGEVEGNVVPAVIVDKGKAYSLKIYKQFFDNFPPDVINGEWANEYKIAPEAKTGVKICQNQQTE